MFLSGNANTGQVLVPLQWPVAGGQAKVSIGTMIPAALINSLMYKLSNFKLKNLQTLSDPAQLSNLSTESEYASCG